LSGLAFGAPTSDEHLRELRLGREQSARFEEAIYRQLTAPKQRIIGMPARRFAMKRSILQLALLLLLAAPAAHAQSYMPLAVGNHWSYASPSGALDD